VLRFDTILLFAGHGHRHVRTRRAAGRDLHLRMREHLGVPAPRPVVRGDVQFAVDVEAGDHALLCVAAAVLGRDDHRVRVLRLEIADQRLERDHDPDVDQQQNRNDLQGLHFPPPIV